jgi:hypothetical protein
MTRLVSGAPSAQLADDQHTVVISKTLTRPCYLRPPGFKHPASACQRRSAIILRRAALRLVAKKRPRHAESAPGPPTLVAGLGGPETEGIFTIPYAVAWFQMHAAYFGRYQLTGAGLSRR